MDERKRSRENAAVQTKEKSTRSKKNTNGQKLKNETSSGVAMRKKLRHGKSDTKATKDEIKKTSHVKKQGRKKISAEAIVSTTVHNQISSQSDDNAGIDSLNHVSQTLEEGIYAVKNKFYSNKIHGRKPETKGTKEVTGSNSKSREIQKKQIRKRMQDSARKKQSKEARKQAGSFGRKTADKSAEFIKILMSQIKEHPMFLLCIAVLIFLLMIISGSLSSCSMMLNGVENITVATSFTAKDKDITAVESDYKKLESELQKKADSVETDHPGYDEYRYELSEIGHNPYQLAALLTVLYEDYTESEVQSLLKTIFDQQYSLNSKEIVEVRTKPETRTGYRSVKNPDGTTSEENYTYEVQVEYNYRILQTTLTNHTLDTVIKGLGLTENQMERYNILVETYGNRQDVFKDDIYAVADQGEYAGYEVPPEALTDTSFANMLQEAKKYLGYPYVWGGSSPSTSFDCSGFVSYVINNCGNGWNIGRQTANGLLAHCTKVSPQEAKPGDLIFFQGTYETSGASHVGIYIGNGMMIHCGNPIKYASVNTSYWQKHFLCYGRIN